MAQVFFISDTHFGHTSLLEKGDRPFATVEEMDETIIRNWNSVIGPDDLVWHLGDFAVSSDPSKIAEIFARLNGRKRLVLGNHDFEQPGVVKPMISALSWDAAPTELLEIATENGQRLVLCHYPLRTWPGRSKGSFHFFGHMHGDLPDYGHSRDVGVDLSDVAFVPRTFEELSGRLSSVLPA